MSQDGQIVTTGEFPAQGQDPRWTPTTPQGEQVDGTASYWDDMSDFTARLANIWSGIMGKEITQKQVILCLHGYELTAAEMFEHDEDSTARALDQLLKTRQVYSQ